MALYHSPKITTDGLILLLDASDINSYPGTGSTWYDLSQSQNHFTLGGSPSYNILTGFRFQNGSDAYYAICNPFQFPISTVSMEVWYKTTTSGASILSYAVNGNDNHALLFSPENIALYGPTGAVSSGVNTANNQWTQIVRTSERSSGSEILYLNGANVFSTTIAAGTDFTTGGSLVIAQEQDCVGGCFDSGQALGGDVIIVRLYNRVLTSTEVEKNYQAQKTRFGL